MMQVNLQRFNIAVDGFYLPCHSCGMWLRFEEVAKRDADRMAFIQGVGQELRTRAGPFQEFEKFRSQMIALLEEKEDLDERPVRNRKLRHFQICQRRRDETLLRNLFLKFYGSALAVGGNFLEFSRRIDMMGRPIESNCDSEGWCSGERLCRFHQEQSGKKIYCQQSPAIRPPLNAPHIVNDNSFQEEWSPLITQPARIST
jgi:hypothetical protein